MTRDHLAGPSTMLPSSSLAGPLVALAAGLGVLAIALFSGSLEPALPTAARAAGAAIGASTLAVLLAALTVRGSVELSVTRVLASLAFGAFAAALGATAGNALPSDLNLFTLGRPPALGRVLPILAALVAFAGSRAILRGESPRRIFLYLLVPALTLEGLPLATPAWTMLALAGGASLVASASRPLPRLAWLAGGLLIVVFALCGALGADPGTSLDVVVRIAALALALTIVAGEGELGARTALQASLVLLIGIALLAGYTKFLLARELSGIEGSARSTGLSLFGRHPNLLAPWFAATTLIALHVAMRRDRFGMRMLGVLALPLGAALLALTASRLAIVAAVFAGCLPLVTRFRLTRRALGIGTVLALVLLAAVFTLPALREKFTQRANLERSVDHRLFRIGVGLDTALASPPLGPLLGPFLGNGPLCWFTQGVHTKPSYFVGETSSDHPHCLPVAILEGCGVLGIGAFLLFLGFGAVAARRALARDPNDWPLARGVLLAAIAQLSSNLLDMGDALETLIPSGLFLDIGILAALGYDSGSPPIETRASRYGRFSLGATACVLAALIGLFLGFAARGRAFLRGGLPARALPEFERSLRLVPFATDVHLDLATASFAAAKRADARAHLERAIELAPGRPDLHEALATLRSSTDNPQGALESARRAFELDPYGATPRRLALVLAELEMTAGNRDRALALIASAIRVDVQSLARLRDPNLPGSIRLATVPLSLDELLTAYDSAYPESDARLKGYRLVREIELALITNDLARAERAQRELEKLAPESASTFKFAASVAKARGQLDEALRAIEGSIAKNPTDPTIRAERADLLLASGATEDAIAEYRKSFPDAFDVYYQTDAVHDALTRLATAQATRGTVAERVTTLRALAFFKRAAKDRAQVFLDLAALFASAQDARSADDAARRALREILAASVTEGTRDLARRIGVQLGVLGRSVADRSAYADSLERVAFAQTAGVLGLELRAALLSELGLERRAKAAAADLRATQR